MKAYAKIATCSCKKKIPESDKQATNKPLNFPNKGRGKLDKKSKLKKVKCKSTSQEGVGDKRKVLFFIGPKAQLFSACA